LRHERNFTTGIYVISASSYTSEDKIENVKKMSGNKAFFGLTLDGDIAGSSGRSDAVIKSSTI